MSFKILILRPEEKFEKIDFENTEVLNLPVTKIVQADKNKILKKLEFIKKLDYIVFTSTLSVNTLREYMGMDKFKALLENFDEIIAIGKKTKDEIKYNKITVPEIQSTSGIIELMKHKKTGKVLVVRSKNGNKNLLSKLRDLGFDLTVLNMYYSTILEPQSWHYEAYKMLKIGKISAIIFTSNMIVKAFFQVLENIDKSMALKNVFIVAIGKETERTLIRKKIKPDYVAEEPDIYKCLATVVTRLDKVR